MPEAPGRCHTRGDRRSARPCGCGWFSLQSEKKSFGAGRVEAKKQSRRHPFRCAKASAPRCCLRQSDARGLREIDAHTQLLDAAMDTGATTAHAFRFIVVEDSKGQNKTDIGNHKTFFNPPLRRSPCEGGRARGIRAVEAVRRRHAAQGGTRGLGMMNGCAA